MALKLLGILVLIGLCATIATGDSFQRIRPRFNEDPGRIINGTLATMEATRHQIGLRKRLNDGYFFGTGHLCGGSLIRSNWVLTAAHCFVDQVIYNGTFLDKDLFIIVMGNLDRFNITNTLTFDIKQLLMQLEVFNLSTYDKDIALLQLDGHVPTNHPTIRPIELRALEVPTDTICQVTGWGLTEDGYNSDYLMTLDVPRISDENCRNSALGGNILAGMLCAGYLEEGQKDACSGDSGGPLVCQSQLAGIVSWGIGCALPDYPGVYTDVAYYYNWIVENIEANTEIGSGEASGEGSGEESGDGSGDDDDDDDDDDDGGGASMIAVTCTLTLLLPTLLALRY